MWVCLSAGEKSSVRRCQEAEAKKRNKQHQQHWKWRCTTREPSKQRSATSGRRRAHAPTATFASLLMASPSFVRSSGTRATRPKFAGWFSPAQPALTATAATSATPCARLD